MAGQRRPSLTNITSRFQQSISLNNETKKSKRKPINTFNNLVKNGLHTTTNQPPSKRLRPIRSNPELLESERKKRRKRQHQRNQAEILSSALNSILLTSPK